MNETVSLYAGWFFQPFDIIGCPLNTECREKIVYNLQDFQCSYHDVSVQLPLGQVTARTVTAQTNSCFPDNNRSLTSAKHGVHDTMRK